MIGVQLTMRYCQGNNCKLQLYTVNGGFYMNISDLITAAADYDKGDPKRISHFIKVYGFAKAIGEAELSDKRQLEILEAAAVLHDIGIHECERKYGSCDGKYQQIEGVPVARELLKKLNADSELTERVCFLIAHHHTYRGIDADDWQILVEADFLVNAFEDSMSGEAIGSVRDKLFKTKTGIRLLEDMYGKF